MKTKEGDDSLEGREASGVVSLEVVGAMGSAIGSVACVKRVVFVIYLA